MTYYEDREIAKKLDEIKNEISDLKNMFKLYFKISFPKNEIYSILNSSEKILAYDLTNGNNTARDISKIIDFSISTINRWWREWLDKGLLSEYYEDNKRYIKKNFNLSDFDIEVPEININYEISYLNNIPNKLELRNILLDKKIFIDIFDLRDFAINTLNIVLLNTNVNYKNLIDIIINKFYNSTKRKQLIFMQALKQRARDSKSPFLKYFEEWEKLIKRDI